MKTTTDIMEKFVFPHHLGAIGEQMGADVACVSGPIYEPMDDMLRDVIETGKDRRKIKIAILLETLGGKAEVAERMVSIIRHHYKEVSFIVPNRAMSAGTILAMSGDRILMDYYSCLGPIDAQTKNEEGRRFSTTNELRKVQEMREKSRIGQLTEADKILLDKVDLRILEEYEQAQKLAEDLLTDWLSKYKFKNWKQTATRKIKVTPAMRRERAMEIAKSLGDYDRWHTHGRPIGIDALRELKLEVEDFAENEDLAHHIRTFSDLLQDFMQKEGYRTWVQLGTEADYDYND